MVTLCGNCVIIVFDLLLLKKWTVYSEPIKCTIYEDCYSNYTKP